MAKSIFAQELDFSQIRNCIGILQKMRTFIIDQILKKLMTKLFNEFWKPYFWPIFANFWQKRINNKFSCSHTTLFRFLTLCQNLWTYGRKDEQTFQSTVGDPIKLLSSLCKPSYLKYVLLMHLHIAKNLFIRWSTIKQLQIYNYTNYTSM